MLRFIAASLILVAGCKPDNGVIRQTAEDVFYQEPTDEVDILWVIDNSLSMEDEQAEVAARFHEFITSLEDSLINFHIGIVTTDMEDPAQSGKLVAPAGEEVYLTPDTPNYAMRFQQRVQVGIDGSDREKGIDAAYQALASSLAYDHNSGFRRDGATLSIIYVSDENDCTDQGALAGYDDQIACYEHSDQLVSMRELIDEYHADVVQDDARTLISSIVGPQIVDNCDGAVPGFRYSTMAEAFGGVQASICEADFSGIMTSLGVQVSGVMDSFQLSYSAVPDSIEVYVDETQVQQSETSGWSYDETYWMVYFHGDAVPPRGSKITIHYEIAAGVSEPAPDVQ